MGFRYDEKGVAEEEPVMAAPEGVYTLVIVKASDEKDGLPRITKNGDNYVSVEAEIDDDIKWLGKKVWTNITFMKNDENGNPRKGSGIAIKFLKCIKEPFQVPFDVAPSNWIGKRFRARLVVGKDNKGRPKNEVAYFVTDESQATDDVPF